MNSILIVFFSHFRFFVSKLVTTPVCSRYLTAGYTIESDVKCSQTQVVVIKEIVLFDETKFNVF